MGLRVEKQSTGFRPTRLWEGERVGLFLATVPADYQTVVRPNRIGKDLSLHL